VDCQADSDTAIDPAGELEKSKFPNSHAAPQGGLSIDKKTQTTPRKLRWEWPAHLCILVIRRSPHREDTGGNFALFPQ